MLFSQGEVKHLNQGAKAPYSDSKPNIALSPSNFLAKDLISSFLLKEHCLYRLIMVSFKGYYRKKMIKCKEGSVHFNNPDLCQISSRDCQNLNMVY